MSPGLFFLNMYFLGGVSASFKMLACRDDMEGGSFLRASPSMKCWEGDHNRLAAGAIVVVIFYGIGVPCMYCWVLFCLLPRLGRGSEFVRAFNFLYERFEKRHWYHELVNLSRKIAFVAIAVFGAGEPLIQSVAALGVIIVALIIDLVTHPYVSDLYDVLEESLTLVQFVVIMLGVVLLASEETHPSWVTVIGWALMSFSFIMILYVAGTDIHAFALRRRAARLSSELPKCALSPVIFNTDYEDGLLVDWLRSQEEQDGAPGTPPFPLEAAEARPLSNLEIFRHVERMLLAALFNGELDAEEVESLDLKKQIEVVPYLLDGLVADPTGALPCNSELSSGSTTGAAAVDGLRAYMHGFRGICPFGSPPSVFFFSEQLRGSLPRWLFAVERTMERQLLHDLFFSLHTFAAQRSAKKNIWQRWSSRLIKSADSKKEAHEKTIIEAAEESGHPSEYGMLTGRWFAHLLMRKPAQESKEASFENKAVEGIYQRLKLLNSFILAEVVALVPIRDSKTLKLPQVFLEHNRGGAFASGSGRSTGQPARILSLDQRTAARQCIKQRVSIRVDNQLEIGFDEEFSIDIISQLYIPVFAKPRKKRSWEMATSAATGPPEAEEVVGVLICWNKRGKASSKAGFAFNETDTYMGRLVAELVVEHVHRLQDDALFKQEKRAATHLQLSLKRSALKRKKRAQEAGLLQGQAHGWSNANESHGSNE